MRSAGAITLYTYALKLELSFKLFTMNNFGFYFVIASVYDLN